MCGITGRFNYDSRQPVDHDVLVAMTDGIPTDNKATCLSDAATARTSISTSTPAAFSLPITSGSVAAS